MIIFQRSFDGAIPFLDGIQIPGAGCQLEEEEIQLGVVDDVVAFVVQLAVDVAQQSADPFHGQHALEHADGDHAAELIQGIPLLLRFGQESPLDPVLNGVGIQTGDAGDLAQGNAAAEEQSLELTPDGCGILPLNGEGGAWNCPVHDCSLLSMWDRGGIITSLPDRGVRELLSSCTMIITHGRVIVKRGCVTLYNLSPTLFTFRENCCTMVKSRKWEVCHELHEVRP